MMFFVGVDIARTFLLLGCMAGKIVGWSMGLGGALPWSMVVIYGVPEVDFFCYFAFGVGCILAGPQVPAVGDSQVAQVVLSRWMG